jgi:biotin carboxyl carrier protein
MRRLAQLYQGSQRHLTRHVCSPIVRIFYPDRQGKALVREGDTVAGCTDLVCDRDRRRVLNEIESEIAGKVAVIHVRNGARVELDVALFESVARRL